MKDRLNKNISYSNLSLDTLSSTMKDYSYENYGENFEESLQRGFRDIANMYNNSFNKPKLSFQCCYYCNLNNYKKGENDYLINLQFEKFAEALSKSFESNNEK